MANGRFELANSKLIVNLTCGEVLCVSQIANRPWSRMKGLIGCRGLPAGEGLLLSPAPAVHTAFMSFPIDAVFLDRELRVLHIASSLAPWRLASTARARAVLELAAGECARRGLKVGHRLGLRDRTPAPDTARDAARRPSAVRVPPTSESIIWPGDVEATNHAPATRPICVVVVSGDRHFRSVTTMLLGHRGCPVVTTSSRARASELAARDAIDVVVVDAETSQPDPTDSPARFPATVGVVVVHETRGRQAREAVLSKWGPFEDLFAAIQQAAQRSQSSAIT